MPEANPPAQTSQPETDRKIREAVRIMAEKRLGPAADNILRGGSQVDRAMPDLSAYCIMMATQEQGRLLQEMQKQLGGQTALMKAMDERSNEMTALTKGLNRLTVFMLAMTAVVTAATIINLILLLCGRVP